MMRLKDSFANLSMESYENGESREQSLSRPMTPGKPFNCRVKLFSTIHKYPGIMKYIDRFMHKQPLF
jgi:hypothetical protein